MYPKRTGISAWSVNESAINAPNPRRPTIIIIPDKKFEIQLENSHIPVVCEQVLFETFPMEDQQAEGILVKPDTIKKLKFNLINNPQIFYMPEQEAPYNNTLLF